jgi:hypothetical protein
LSNAVKNNAWENSFWNRILINRRYHKNRIIGRIAKNIDLKDPAKREGPSGEAAYEGARSKESGARIDAPTTCSFNEKVSL